MLLPGPVLITGGGTVLARTLADALVDQTPTVALAEQRRALTCASAADLPGNRTTSAQRVPVRCCELGDGNETDAAVAAVKQIVHIQPDYCAPALSESGQEDPLLWLDYATRCTYNLLLAAASAGVEHCIIVSSMEVFASLPPDLATPLPGWRPRPSPYASSLSFHLAEFTAAQFGRHPDPGSGIRISFARLGAIHPHEGAARAAGARWWTTMSNAIETLRHALKEGCDIPRGQINVVHVADSVHGDHRHRLPKPWPVGESRALSQPPNKILVLGAQGVMGPPAVEALAAAGLTVRATDIGLRDPSRDPQQRARAVEHPAVAGVEYQVVDIADATAVARAAAGVHCIVNCAVSRQHRTNAFNVNVRGTYNALTTALDLGHTRFINSGPSGTIVGPELQNSFHLITEDVPAWPGTGLYYISKGLGHELTRVFCEHIPTLHVLLCVYGGVGSDYTLSPPPEEEGQGIYLQRGGWASALPDCAAALLACTQVSLSKLPSNHEAFFISNTDVVQMIVPRKATRILGWRPSHRLKGYYLKPKM